MDYGTHEELMQRCELYRQISESQMGGFWMIPKETQTQKKSGSKKQVILRLGKYLLRYKGLLFGAITLTVVGNLCLPCWVGGTGYAIGAIGTQSWSGKLSQCFLRAICVLLFLRRCPICFRL